MVLPHLQQRGLNRCLSSSPSPEAECSQCLPVSLAEVLSPSRGVTVSGAKMQSPPASAWWLLSSGFSARQVLLSDKTPSRFTSADFPAGRVSKAGDSDLFAEL